MGHCFLCSKQGSDNGRGRGPGLDGGGGGGGVQAKANTETVASLTARTSRRDRTLFVLNHTIRSIINGRRRVREAELEWTNTLDGNQAIHF